MYYAPMSEGKRYRRHEEASQRSDRATLHTARTDTHGARDRQEDAAVPK